MEITITIKDGSDESAALARAHAAYSVDNPGLTQQGYLQMLVNGQMSNLVTTYAAAKDADTYLRASKVVAYVVTEEPLPMAAPPTQT